MKALLSVVVLSLGFVLSGCALVQPAAIPVDQSLPKAAQTAQSSINEANILIIATANVVAQNFKDGIYTESEKNSYRDKLKHAAQDVDAAQVLLRAGDITKATNQAALIKMALTALHKEVAAKARSKP